MWNAKYLTRIDLRVIPVILALMFMSLLIISANSAHGTDPLSAPFMTAEVRRQLQWFGIGGLVYLFFAGFDYNKLREWTWLLYIIMLIALIGLFFTEPIQGVRRWYRIPFISMNFQPSEFAKIISVISLSWFLERCHSQAWEWSTTFYASVIIGIPFLLILKQPDLGSALVLFPITLVMFYFGNIRPSVVRFMSFLALGALILVALIFLSFIPHEQLRPYATKVLKEYQFARLDPNTHHQKAAATAISLGGITGSGWRKSEFTGGGWLPATYTDSVFPAFGEEFGFLGLLLMMVLFYALIYFSFQATVVSKDHFGRLLSAGITVYLAMHILVNIGMMCSFLPITGIPLILVTYGGSSILFTMAALGILQSIYSRRFMF